MLQYATYAVISPEGCASILWKSAERAADAAEAMGITSERLYELELIDRIVTEPLGGAHRDPHATAATLKAALVEELQMLEAMGADARMQQRERRLRGYGVFEEV
jgi:acetyl-CoA carboxylase carboxyl transferase subunit alpha